MPTTTMPHKDAKAVQARKRFVHTYGEKSTKITTEERASQVCKGMNMNFNVSEGAGQKLHYKLQRRETLQRREKGANICWDAVHIMIWRGGTSFIMVNNL